MSSAETSSNLRPSSVEIYAEIGHLTTFCEDNLLLDELGSDTVPNIISMIKGDIWKKRSKPTIL